MKDNQSPKPLKIEPALLTIPQVCQILNISRPEFYARKATGEFGLLPLGLGACRKVLYSRFELEVYLRTSTIEGKCIHRQQWQKIRKDLLCKLK
jgi:hypothetical protein